MSDKQILSTTGWVVKNLETGEVDVETRHPATEQYARTRKLVEGFEWVEVNITYTETGGKL